jgi:carotenoid cleavage dioxygenase-like enzyme
MSIDERGPTPALRLSRPITRRDFIQTGGSLAAFSGVALMTGFSAVRHAAAPEAAPAISTGAWTSTSPFLSGAFAPVFDERDDVDLRVEGEIPRSLRGVFMRNGPNPEFQPDDHYAYPFDGTGMVHAVSIADGKARYRNRWVLTKELAEERAAGRRLYNSTFSPPPHADLANTNIIRHAGRYLALYEGGLPYEIDRELKTIGLFDYGGGLPGRMSAHPKLDPVTGELLSLAYDTRTGTLTYLRANRQGQLDRIVPFPSPWPAMVHDVAITERHLVACVGPAVFDLAAKGPPVTWQPDRGAKVAVVPRDARASEDVRWIGGAPFFNFHCMNAVADGDRIEIVVPWYDRFSLGAPAKRLELHKLTLDTKSGSMSDTILDDRACEFPRVNDALLGRRTRYGYVALRDPRAGESPQLGAFESFARYDVTNGTKTVHAFPAGMTVCEPVFVADPARSSEGDGFLFSFVHDAATATGSFVILDASHLEGEPIATVRLPRRVPAGLHGSWLPA